MRKAIIDIDPESKKSTAEEELESGAAGLNSCSKMLVLGTVLSPLNFQLTDFQVSATNEARDELQRLIQDSVTYSYKLAELDYQPS